MAEVALAAVRGDQSLAWLAEQFDVYRNRLSSSLPLAAAA